MVKWFASKKVKNNFIEIDGLELELPKDTQLLDFRVMHKMYDRFLPYLAQLSGNKAIIDIGANVGDTVAAMLKHTDSVFYCVEPSRTFYNLLCKNIENWGGEFMLRVSKH